MRLRKIIKTLADAYPGAATELKYKTPFQLLVAVMLSAQCTDQRVNMITEKLFTRHHGPEDFAMLSEEGLASEIKSCGLYRSKSRHIIETSRIIMGRHGGQVPGNRLDLERLPGVGRKTASVVLSVIFNEPVMPVDTHVFRVSKRLGLTSGKNPVEVEHELLNLIAPEETGYLHHCLIAHGRKICTARKPRCCVCPLISLCPRKGFDHAHCPG
ncbi:MAG: endonuclease III [Bacillota bacterium]|jgi:endonuclease-3